MRRIDLLPPEERRRRGRPGRLGVELPAGGVLGILLISGAVVLLVMVGLYVLYSMQLSDQRDRIAELDQRISNSNQRLAELSPYRDLQSKLDAKDEIASGIANTRFEWARFLRGLAFVIPDSTSLQSFTAEAAPIDISASPGETLPPGDISFTGVAVPGYTNVASFLVQMNDLRYLFGVSLDSAELDRQTFASPAINFESSAELVTEVEERDILRGLEPINQPANNSSGSNPSPGGGASGGAASGGAAGGTSGGTEDGGRQASPTGGTR